MSSFFVLGALEHAAKATERGLEDGHAVAGQHAGNAGTANHEQLVGRCMDDGLHRATVCDVATEHTDKQQNNTNDRKHLLLLVRADAPACQPVRLQGLLSAR